MSKILEIEFTNREITTLEISAGNANVDINGMVNKMVVVSVNQGIQGPVGEMNPDAILDGGIIF